MKLALIMQYLGKEQVFPDIDISSVTCDSRQVEKNSIFVCIPAENVNSDIHIKDALEKGAAWIISQESCDNLPNQTFLSNARKAYAMISAVFFNNPAKEMNLIGVTGTNGKTTTTWLIKQILENMGEKVGLIGTICNQISGDPPITLPAHYTTPDSWELQGLLRRMADKGCSYVVIEASSHALTQYRLEGCDFLCGVFTNLTPEHLDYHKDMEEYYQAKKSLFDNCTNAVINFDDPYGKRLIRENEGAVSFSVGDKSAEMTAEKIFSEPMGNRFDVRYGKSEAISTYVPMPGEFSVSNAMAALAALYSCGFSMKELGESLCKCGGVPGRTQVLTKDKDFTVLRDYAHTPDGLEKILTAVNKSTKGRVMTVFGCPGRRDRGKRPQMARVVSELSDLVVMTADNPREEPLEQIFKDALPGLESGETPYQVIPDRRSAIIWALSQCQKEDTLILAGKGHEDYQVLSDRTILFDEKKIVEEYLFEKTR